MNVLFSFELAGIQRIFVNIAMRQVAAPGGSFAIAKMQVNRDSDFVVYHRMTGRYLIVLCRHALFCDLYIADGNIVAALIECAATGSQRGQRYGPSWDRHRLGRIARAVRA